MSGFCAVKVNITCSDFIFSVDEGVDYVVFGIETPAYGRDWIFFWYDMGIVKFVSVECVVANGYITITQF